MDPDQGGYKGAFYGGGAACCCIPRRAFVALLAAAWLFYYIGDIFHLLIWYPMMTPPTTPRECTSHRCLKVFSCKGMRDATHHTVEPIWMLGGLIFGALGLHGAVAMNHQHLQAFAYFQLLAAVIYFGFMFFDGLYMEVCDHYPGNVIHQVLFTGIPDFPITDDKKQALNDMELYPIKLVNQHTDMNLWRWYILGSTISAVFFFYCTQVTMLLSRIYTEGPIGLGVNYRLGVWRAEVLLKHRIEELEDELVFGVKEDLGLNDQPKQKDKVEHLAAEGKQNYGTV